LCPEIQHITASIVTAIFYTENLKLCREFHHNLYIF